MKEFGADLVPGLRIIKTSVAVLICLLTFYAFKYYNPIYAVIACVLMMKSSVEESFKSGIQRIVGTVMGGIAAIIFINLLQALNIAHENIITVIIISIGVLILLMLSKATHADSYVGSMAVMVFLIIMLSNNATKDNHIEYIVVRVLETTYGVVIAVLVNRYLNFKTRKQK